MSLFSTLLYGSEYHRDLHVLTHSVPTRRSSDLSLPLPLSGDRGVDLPRLLQPQQQRVRRLPDAAVRRVRLYAALLQFFAGAAARSEEHTSELQTLMRISYAAFCSKQKITIYSHEHITRCQYIYIQSRTVL